MLEFDGSKLKTLRKKKGLTQTELANQVGKTFSHIASYENGYSTPPSDVLLNLIKIFRISADRLSRTREEVTE